MSCGQQEGRTPLHLATEGCLFRTGSEIAEIVTAVLEAGVDPDQIDKVWHCTWNSLRYAERGLLLTPCNPGTPAQYETFPIFAAARHGCAASIEAFIKAGANLNPTPSKVLRRTVPLRTHHSC